MTIMGQEKPSLEDLAHFGVKGMRWGVRKATDLTPDVLNRDFGKRALKRIDKKVLTRDRRTSSAAALRKAVNTEDRRRTVIKVAVTLYAAAVAKNLYQNHSQQILSSVVNARVAKNGARAAANLLADTHGLTRTSEINVAFNAAKNIWE